MNQKNPDSESLFFKIVAFLSLTDTEVLTESGRYDRMLAYAMVFRQLVTFVFTLLLFTYGVSLFLGPVASIVSGTVFALTLFFLDQAIIGSDWALKNPFKGGVPFRKLLGLIPRILYSLIIAIGLATLAEISLQANAIDSQIQKDTVDNNKEYFARIQSYEAELDTAVNLSEQKIIDRQAQLSDVRAEQLVYRDADQAYDSQTITNSIDHYQVSLEELQTVQKITIGQLSELNTRLATTRKDYQFWFNEALMERTGQDGRAPTEGPKYQRAEKTYAELQAQIPGIEADIVTTKQRLTTVEQNIIVATGNLNEFQQKSNTLLQKDSNFSNNEQLLLGMQIDLDNTQVLLSSQIQDKQIKLDEFRVKLQNEGLFYERKTGVLTRYLALNKIHSDPEIGEVATMFSYMLKIFFIAIELMPVIIKLFFSPFSFYSLKMYRKMHIALLEEQALVEIAELKYSKEKEQRKLLTYRNQQIDDDIGGTVIV